jgi:nucleotide-binding universal stress UspA family protein
MKKFIIKKILIPVDFSETANTALSHGVFMAKLHKAEVILLHTHETIIYTSAIDYSAISANVEYEALIEKSIKERLSDLVEKIHAESSVDVSARMEIGRIYRSIIDVAKEVDADIIVMGTHGVSGVQEFLIGSNTFRVVTESPCPVLSLQSSVTKYGFKNIVLPIDDSHASRQKVNHAIEIAKSYGSVIHIAGLISSDEKDHVHRMNIKIKQVEEYIKKHDIALTVKVINGSNLANMAQTYAKEIAADLIIIMTEQEPHLTGFLIGPYAQQVVNHSIIPVLSIHPEKVSDGLLNASF